MEMQNKRHDYEDAMKKAFMRGVCALNLEAMTIFQGKEFKFDHGEYYKESKYYQLASSCQWITCAFVLISISQEN